MNIYFDMDGTLAEFRSTVSTDDLYLPNFFYTLTPQMNVVKAAEILNEDPDYEVYILTSCLADSKYAAKDKKRWLDKYMPFIKDENILICEYGKPKATMVPGGHVTASDVLVDDYTKYLVDWENAGGTAVKLYNGINGTNGTWASMSGYGLMMLSDKGPVPSSLIAQGIKEICKGRENNVSYL